MANWYSGVLKCVLIYNRPDLGLMLSKAPESAVMGTLL